MRLARVVQYFLSLFSNRCCVLCAVSQEGAAIMIQAAVRGKLARLSTSGEVGVRSDLTRRRCFQRVHDSTQFPLRG